MSKREPLTGISKGEPLKQFFQGSSGFEKIKLEVILSFGISTRKTKNFEESVIGRTSIGTKENLRDA